MAAATTARRQPAVRPARQATPRRADLRVVRSDRRVVVVGALGSAVVVTFFGVLFVIAGLHAVLVQTQAQIDAQRAANAEVQEQLDDVVAQLAWIDTPEGLEQWARTSGLIEAPEVVSLAPLPAGALAPPVSADPFAGPTTEAAE
jgi:type II secretory pathway pseudopilin PulG